MQSGLFFMVARIYKNLPVELAECTHCHWALPVSAFQKRRTKRGFVPRSWCNKCRHIPQSEKARLSHRERSRRNAKRPSNKRRQCVKFGITLLHYEEMLQAQGGVCAICGKQQEGRSLSVDHCHETGRIRGLLCTRCNLGIGNLQDDPGVLRKAIEYLR